MSSLTDKLKERKQSKQLIESPLFGARDRVENIVREEIKRFKDDIKKELHSLLKEALGDEGVQTLKGERGHTPQVGIDFFTPEQIAQFQREAKGKDGIDGRDADEEKIITEVLNQIPTTPDYSQMIKKLSKRIKDLTGQDIVKLLEALPPSERLSFFKLKDVPSTQNLGGKTLHRGGVDTKVLTATGSLNGSNTDFTFTKKPTVIVVNGSSYRENHGWSWSGLTATLDFAPSQNADLYGIL